MNRRGFIKSGLGCFGVIIGVILGVASKSPAKTQELTVSYWTQNRDAEWHHYTYDGKNWYENGKLLNITIESEEWLRYRRVYEKINR